MLEDTGSHQSSGSELSAQERKEMEQRVRDALRQRIVSMVQHMQAVCRCRIARLRYLWVRWLVRSAQASVRRTLVRQKYTRELCSLEEHVSAQVLQGYFRRASLHWRMMRYHANIIVAAIKRSHKQRVYSGYRPAPPQQPAPEQKRPSPRVQHAAAAVAIGRDAAFDVAAINTVQAAIRRLLLQHKAVTNSKNPRSLQHHNSSFTSHKSNHNNSMNNIDPELLQKLYPPMVATPPALQPSSNPMEDKMRAEIEETLRKELEAYLGALGEAERGREIRRQGELEREQLKELQARMATHIARSVAETVKLRVEAPAPAPVPPPVMHSPRFAKNVELIESNNNNNSPRLSPKNRGNSFENRQLLNVERSNSDGNIDSPRTIALRARVDSIPENKRMDDSSLTEVAPVPPSGPKPILLRENSRRTLSRSVSFSESSPAIVPSPQENTAAAAAEEAKDEEKKSSDTESVIDLDNEIRHDTNSVSGAATMQTLVDRPPTPHFNHHVPADVEEDEEETTDEEGKKSPEDPELENQLHEIQKKRHDEAEEEMRRLQAEQQREERDENMRVDDDGSQQRQSEQSSSRQQHQGDLIYNGGEENGVELNNGEEEEDEDDEEARFHAMQREARRLELETERQTRLQERRMSGPVRNSDEEQQQYYHEQQMQIQQQQYQYEYQQQQQQQQQQQRQGAHPAPPPRRKPATNSSPYSHNGRKTNNNNNKPSPTSMMPPLFFPTAPVNEQQRPPYGASSAPMTILPPLISPREKIFGGGGMSPRPFSKMQAHELEVRAAIAMLWQQERAQSIRLQNALQEEAVAHLRVRATAELLGKHRKKMRRRGGEEEEEVNHPVA